MDTLVAVFQWLMVHQPPMPLSLFLVLIGVSWPFFVRASYRKDVDANSFFPIGGMVIPVGGYLIGIMAATQDHYWYHLISPLLGVAAGCGVMLLGAMARNSRTTSGRAAGRFRSWRNARRERYDREQTEAKRRLAENAELFAKSPQGKLKLCREAVDEYRASLPKGLAWPKQMAEAERKLDVLEELYGFLGRLDHLSPTDDGFLEQRFREADAVFPDVSLEQECGQLLAELRKEQQKLPELRRRVHGAIEGLIAYLTTLPNRAANHLREEIPLQYAQAAEDLKEELGTPVLPRLTDDDAAEALTPRRSESKLTA